nr:TraB/GumN family protein [Candidatus Woesearchaeota archaeon]
MTKLPFLWQVKKNEAVSYLLGTAHLKEKDESIEESTKDLASKVRVMYVETPEDFQLQERHITLPEGQRIDDFLTQDEIDNMHSFFQEHYQRFLFPEEIKEKFDEMHRKKLWYITSEISSIAYSDEEIEYLAACKRLKELKQRFFGSIILPQREEILNIRSEAIDLVKIIQNYETKTDKSIPTLDNSLRFAMKSSGIKIIGLDEPDEYSKIYDSLSIEAQKQILFKEIEEVKSGKFFNNDQIRSYKKGDLEAQLKSFEAKNPVDQEFVDNVCHGRTALWYPKTQEDIKIGRTLIAVGTSHFLTEHGYIAMLEKNGYEVKKL